jgi:hypothetical protein
MLAWCPRDPPRRVRRLLVKGDQMEAGSPWAGVGLSSRFLYFDLPHNGAEFYSRAGQVIDLPEGGQSDTQEMPSPGTWTPSFCASATGAIWTGAICRSISSCKAGRTPTQRLRPCARYTLMVTGE